MKNELETILKAFEDYIESQNYFDIVYSKKIGYVRILVDHPGDAGAEVMDSPETLLDALFNDIIGDVINAPGNRDPRADSPALNTYEETECRHRIAAILETIEGDSAEYLDYLDDYLKTYQERYNGGTE